MTHIPVFSWKELMTTRYKKKEHNKKNVCRLNSDDDACQQMKIISKTVHIRSCILLMELYIFLALMIKSDICMYIRYRKVYKMRIVNRSGWRRFYVSKSSWHTECAHVAAYVGRSKSSTSSAREMTTSSHPNKVWRGLRRIFLQQSRVGGSFFSCPTKFRPIHPSTKPFLQGLSFRRNARAGVATEK